MGEKTDSYTAGVGSFIFGAIIFIMSLNTGGLTSMAGQVYGLIGTVFAVLGIGCFSKPEIFGPIVSNIFSKVDDSNKENSFYIQKQFKPQQSHQIQGAKNVTINDNSKHFYGSKKKKF